MPTKPRSRDDFEIAIICALTLEADMVELILDKDWADESTTFGKAVGDQNCYTTGVIAKHNVVLAFSSGMGSNSAAMVATGLRSSYRNINIAFVVGICGVVPNHMETQEDIVLGDCIVSAEVIQYDFGRQYPGVFQPKDDSLRRANPQIRAFMTKLRTSRNTHRVNTRLVKHLGVLQKSQPKSVYPGTAQDRLFQSTYLHSHKGSTAECDKCLDGDICTKDCKTIGCLPAHLVPRHRLESDANATKNDPKLHFGRLGSANTVMKSGIDRDRIAKAHQLIAFEMEVSGVCDILPVVMVKSACDYADSHKSKDWQDYAAATAAAGLKAVLEQWESAQSTSQVPSEPVFQRIINLPDIRVTHFVERITIMKDIETWFEFEDIPLIILGMGGGGKSQLALEFGRKVLARKDCSVVFWINASSPSTVKQSLKIVVSKLLDSKNISDDVERNLSRITAELKQKRWLAIFDNFDDPDAFHEHRLSWYFPRDGRGHILVTSRHTGSARLGKSLELSTMTEIESLALLLQRPINGIDQNPDGLKIASELGYLPLALDQAGSYIRARGVRLEDFLDHYRIRRKQILQELPSQWEYRRDTTTRTKTVCLLSAFTTWELSFEQISGDQATRKAKEHFLTISAFFDLNSISREYFKSYCEFTTGGWSQIFRRNDVWDDFEYGDVVAEYRALSLIQTRQHKHEAISEFTLHPVVQEWLKLRIDATQKQAMAEEFTFLLCIYLKSTDIVNAGLSTIGEAVANINASIMHDERFNNTPNFTTRFPLGAALILCTALSNFGHTSAAKSLGELALISSQQPSGDDELLVFILTDLVANEYELSGHTEKAFNLQKVAAARAQAQLGTDHIITIMMMRTLSRIYYAQGYESKAISLLEQMLIKVRQELGPMALDTITCLRDLGRLYYFTNRYEQAKLLLLEAWEASNEMYGCFDLTVLSIQNDLGELYANCSDWEQAEQYLNRSVTNYQDTLGPLHHLTLESQVLLARHYFRTGRFDESESILRSTLAIQADAYGAEDIQVCWTVYNLAVCLFFRGTYVGAQQLCQRLLSAYEKRYGMEKMCIQNMQKLRDLEKRIQDAMVMDEPRRISRMEEEDAMGRDVPPSEQMEDELSAIVPMPQNIQHNRNNPSKRGLSSLLKKIFH